MTAPTTTPSEPGFFELLARLHGHRCPMSILGARLGLAAREALGPLPEGRRLRGRYCHQTCALDGIQLATGCTLGNRNLEVDSRGEHRFDLWADDEARVVSARLSGGALERGRAYAELRQCLERLPRRSSERGLLETRMAAMLEDLETAPASDLVEISAPGGAASP